MTADKSTYLSEEVRRLKQVWPENKNYHIVCHGHSIPCGYTAAHVVRTFDAYPHQLHQILNQRFPTAVINIITSAIGGENSVSGAKRFREEVLCHRPDLVTLDYGRNDMYLTREAAEAAWRQMIEAGLAFGAKLILITPAPDCRKEYYTARSSGDEELSDMIRRLAAEYGVGLADAAQTFDQRLALSHLLSSYLISVNHLTREGHGVIAADLADWFPYVC
ncbi:lysophospholipase L1-like esterase [Anaerotaenia torta]|uniref:SGNH/GDSL hydrolase family protein n=1 Tax=Anaerotaenia torta TaxID=433293 RepID=UPI003D1A5FD8